MNRRRHAPTAGGRTLLSVSVLAWAILSLCSCQSKGVRVAAAPDESEHGGEAHHLHRNELTFAVGELYEAEENGVRLGIDYERRSPDGWWGFMGKEVGLGALADFNADEEKSWLLGLQWVYHPTEEVALIVAPAYFDSDREDLADSLALRLGSRYSFPISPGWSLGPEIFFDMLEAGERRGALALALTRGF